MATGTTTILVRLINEGLTCGGSFFPECLNPAIDWYYGHWLFPPTSLGSLKFDQDVLTRGTYLHGTWRKSLFDPLQLEILFNVELNLWFQFVHVWLWDDIAHHIRPHSREIYILFIFCFFAKYSVFGKCF